MDRILDTLIGKFESDYQQGTQSVTQKPQIYLEQLYKIRNTMNFHQTRESLLSFLIGGFDTTGKAIPTILLLLAMHQEVQEKVFDELNIIISYEDDGFSEDSLSKMKYLEMVMKESLRLIPIALIFGREVKKDIKLSKILFRNKSFT